jgi:hypothetical protein
MQFPRIAPLSPEFQARGNHQNALANGNPAKIRRKSNQNVNQNQTNCEKQCAKTSNMVW